MKLGLKSITKSITGISPALRMGLYVGGGAMLGYLWYATVGCSTGTCPITSRWYTSMLYGAVVGLVAGWPAATTPKNEKPEQDKQPD